MLWISLHCLRPLVQLHPCTIRKHEKYSVSGMGAVVFGTAANICLIKKREECARLSCFLNSHDQFCSWLQYKKFFSFTYYNDFPLSRKSGQLSKLSLNFNRNLSRSKSVPYPLSLIKRTACIYPAQSSSLLRRLRLRFDLCSASPSFESRGIPIPPIYRRARYKRMHIQTSCTLRSRGYSTLIRRFIHTLYLQYLKNSVQFRASQFVQIQSGKSS